MILPDVKKIDMEVFSINKQFTMVGMRMKWRFCHEALTGEMKMK